MSDPEFSLVHCTLAEYAFLENRQKSDNNNNNNNNSLGVLLISEPFLVYPVLGLCGSLLCNSMY